MSDFMNISDEWAGLGRETFKKAKRAKLSRVGVIDIGSNSVRLVVFDGAARSPAYFFNEKIMCALGRELETCGHLHPQGRVRALKAIDRFVGLCRRMEVSSLDAVATAAVREALDGQEFAYEVEARTGLKVRIVDGAEEAFLSAQGVLLGWPDAKGIMCDLGGASMEFARVDAGEIGACWSAPIGPLKLMSLKASDAKKETLIKSTVKDFSLKVGAKGERLYLVGGVFRAFARLDMARRNYPLLVLHEYRMQKSDIRATIEWIEQIDLNKIGRDIGTSSARLALIPFGAKILKMLVSYFKPSEICVSAYGIREGLLYDYMPLKMRARDPLLEACKFSEHQSARHPGLGRQLYEFIAPVMSKIAKDKMRIIKAACLLHDVNWRAHPDYRALVCFESVTRANLGGLTHKERVFLGLSLLHRYRNRTPAGLKPIIALLTGEAQREAEILGKALRFAAMFAVDGVGDVARLRWKPRKRELILELKGEGIVLYGEVAQVRFEALSARLSADFKVKKVKEKREKMR